MASIVFFLVFFSAAAGVRATDVRLVVMARVVGASERALARHVVWPGAVPYIFAGLKISLSYAIGAAVVFQPVAFVAPCGRTETEITSAGCTGFGSCDLPTVKLWLPSAL